MTGLTLHPINHGFSNETIGAEMEYWFLYPDHLRNLLLGEYQFVRHEGISRRGARWHVWRMLAMLSAERNNGWTAIPWDEQDDEWLDDALGGAE